jgi:uncharacterized membrane protein
VLPFIAAAAFWGRFPDRVVTHWGGDGRPNGWMNKIPGLLGTPLLSVAVALLTGWIPRLDPRFRRDPEGSERSIAAIGIIRLAVTALMCFGSLLIVAEALGHHFNGIRIGINVILLFFLVMGNYIGTVRPNYFVGFRTPWTLENDEVWRATHRLIGRVWVFGALAFLGFQFAIPQSLVMPCSVAFFVGTAVLSVPYSYWRFRSASPRRGSGA